MCEASTGAELGAVAREQVDDATGKVGGRDRLGQLERGERLRLGRDDDRRVAAHDRGSDAGDEAVERRRFGARIATTPVGSGTVKLK